MTTEEKIDLLIEKVDGISIRMDKLENHMATIEGIVYNIKEKVDQLWDWNSGQGMSANLKKLAK